jgi:hypothetical protein
MVPWPLNLVVSVAVIVFLIRSKHPHVE